MSKTRLVLALATMGVILLPGGAASAAQTQSNQQQRRDEQKESEKPSLKVVRKVAPVYPEEAMHEGIEGKVVLDVTIEANGEVSDVKVVTGHRLLNQAALDAIKQWRFANGFNDTVATQITFQFSPGDRPDPAPAQETRLKIVHKVNAVYPEEAKRKRIQGEVAVEITVDEQGKLIDARVKSGDELLHQPSLDAVRQFRFENTLAKKVQATITFNFVLGDK